MPNKVHPVVGMRRAGKTSDLRQVQADRQRALQAERAVYMSFDDDRLADLRRHNSATGGALILQVCANLGAAETLTRELRALDEAAHEHPHAKRFFLVLDWSQALAVARPGVQVQPAYEWLLDGKTEPRTAL